MKIVIISPFQFKMLRGIERYVYAIGNELSECEVKVIIYSWSEHQSVNWGEWHPNIKIRKVPFFKYFRGYWASLFYRFWLIKDKPDTTILNFLYHGEELLPSNKQYKYILHSPASQIPNRYKYIQERLIRFPKLNFIAVSKFVKKEATKYFPNREISVIYNGVDTSLFHPNQKRVDSIRSEKIRLITAAALEERKGIQHVIKAIGKSKRKDIVYHIFGNGTSNQEYKINNLINQYNLRQQVFLYSAVDNIHQVLPNYDVYCLISKGEAFGLGWLEAIASGIPVIVSKHPPYDELIDKVFGICVDENSVEEIITAVDQLTKVRLEKPDTIRSAALKYDWKNIAKQYLKVLNS